MKAKLVMITLYVFVASLFISCLEHSNLRSGNKASEVADENPMAILLETTLEGVNDTVQIAIHGKELQTSRLIKEFYSLNNNFPVWTESMEPNRFSRELLRNFAKAAYYGLDPAFYQLTELEALYYNLKDKEHQEINQKALEFELMMTHNCFKMMSHLSRGLLNPDNTSLWTCFLKNFPWSLLKNFLNLFTLTGLQKE
jgi:murein L,D-transpeptidase YcbB/YkuD